MDGDYLITLLRHAESVGNAENVYQGQKDYPLTEKGREQAQALARRWQEEGATFDHIISSPLTRAKETAEIVASALNIPLEFDELWLERDNGKMSEMNPEEREAAFSKPVSLYRSPGETGEGEWDLYLRAGQAVQSLLNRPAGNYLIVSHGGILNKVLYSILGIAPDPGRRGPRFDFPNAAFARLQYSAKWHSWRVMGLGDLHHLNGA